MDKLIIALLLSISFFVLAIGADTIVKHDVKNTQEVSKTVLEGIY